MSSKIYQIQISLKYSKPKIWRRILIYSNTKLSDFHKILQICTGWRNYHLHQFVKDGICYTKKIDDDFDGDIVDYKNIKVKDLLKLEKDKIFYEYDFGDSWEHNIVLEKILSYDNNVKYPICINGKRNFPPEDCGGIYGYEELINILKNPNHKEYKNMVEWLDSLDYTNFDSEYFNKNEINNFLKEFDN
jgi:hypothetical protein